MCKRAMRRVAASQLHDNRVIAHATRRESGGGCRKEKSRELHDNPHHRARTTAAEQKRTTANKRAIDRKGSKTRGMMGHKEVMQILALCVIACHMHVCHDAVQQIS